MVLIEIFGAGCENCNRLESKVNSAVDHLGIMAEVFVIEDFDILMRRGVTSTPALAINRRMVSIGRVPTVDEIEKLLLNREPYNFEYEE